MLVAVECGWEMLKPVHVRGWLDHVLVVDKSSLKRKIQVADLVGDLGS